MYTLKTFHRMISCFILNLVYRLIKYPFRNLLNVKIRHLIIATLLGLVPLLSIAMSAETVSDLNKNIEQIEYDLQNQNTPSLKIYQYTQTLHEYENRLDECIQEYKDYLAKHQFLVNDIETNRHNPLFIQNENSVITELASRKDIASYCEFLKSKSTILKMSAFAYNYKNFLNDLFIQQTNIFSLFKHTNIQFPYIKFKGLSNQFLSKEIYLSLKFIFLTLMLLGIIKVLKTKYPQGLLKDFKINYNHFLFISFIFLVIVPYQYHFLYTLISHTNNLILVTYSFPNVSILSWLVLLYLLQFYPLDKIKKDSFIILLTYLFLIANYIFTFKLQAYELHHAEYDKLLILKYFILLTVYALNISVSYFLYERILFNQFTTQKYHYYLYVFYTLLLLIGLCGYLDFIFFIFYPLLITILWISFYILYKRYIHYLIKQIGNSKNPLGDYIKKIFKQNLRSLNFNIQLFIQVFNLAIIIEMGVLISILWLILPMDIAFSLYHFVFNPHRIGEYQFTIIYYLRAFYFFIMFNIFNLGFSNKLSTYFFESELSRVKVEKIIYWLATFLALLICLKIARIQINNIGIIIGGLSFGLGFGLKDLVSNYLSGLIIFIHRSIEINDFISVGNFQGYVKEITPLETRIKTIDRDVVIIPNSIITKTIIKNYTFKSKKTHNIHLQYVFQASPDESTIEKEVLPMLLTNKEIIADKNHKPQFILSPEPESNNGYVLDIIVYINQLDKLKEISAKINQNILTIFSKHQYQVSFKKEIHALSQDNF